MAFHTLRISNEQWDKAKRIAAEHLETTGITTTPSNVLLSLLNNALKAYGWSPESAPADQAYSDEATRE